MASAVQPTKAPNSASAAHAARLERLAGKQPPRGADQHDPPDDHADLAANDDVVAPAIDRQIQDDRPDQRPNAQRSRITRRSMRAPGTTVRVATDSISLKYAAAVRSLTIVGGLGWPLAEPSSSVRSLRSERDTIC